MRNSPTTWALQVGGSLLERLGATPEVSGESLSGIGSHPPFASPIHLQRSKHPADTSCDVAAPRGGVVGVEESRPAHPVGEQWAL